MILLLVFGASRLPQLGESLGRTIKGFKRGLASDDKITVQNADGQPARPATPDAKSDKEVAEADIVDKR
jgi:sec-independent protein translocase protein TatA